MNNSYFMTGIIAMAVVSYLPRVIPVILFRKPVKNRFLYSFLQYIPFGILAMLIIPDIFLSTDHLISGVAGAIVAFIFAFRNKGLFITSISATISVLITEGLILLFS